MKNDSKLKAIIIHILIVLIQKNHKQMRTFLITFIHCPLNICFSKFCLSLCLILLIIKISKMLSIIKKLLMQLPIENRVVYNLIESFQQRQMRIDIKDIILLFEKIQEQLNINYVSIVIFTAIDVDSLCTLKIFSKLFKCENIQYKVYPVTTYTELSARIQQSKAYDTVKLFLFINCGGIIDLTQYWLVQQNQAKIFLFDVNKPIHHKNIQSPDIKVIDDGNSQLQKCPTSLQIQKYDEINEYDINSDDQEQLPERDDQDSDRDNSPKRANRRDFKQKLRKHKLIIENKISSYYGRHFFSLPSSYSAYRMIRDIGKVNNEYLWYSIVGLTSMFLEQKITKEVLDDISQILRNDVTRFNLKTGKKQKGAISSRKGYQFTLLDHWSLYESMLNSNYLMTKLHLWEDRGLTRLNEFIHHIGISLQQAKQLYKYMPRESQNKLENSIFVSAQKFGLLQVTYMSFSKQVDYTAAFMASDYYYILTSILESTPKTQIAYDQLHQHRIKCFWEAYDTFDGTLKDLGQRIQDYKRMVRILMTEAKNILQRDHLITTNSISIANIKSDTDDRKMFQHPSALIRIAYLLMGILKEKKKSNNYKPFIANWIDLQKQVCLVVGVMMDSKNQIGMRFNRIAEKLNIQVNHDNFMANIILLQRDKLPEFLKEIGQC